MSNATVVPSRKRASEIAKEEKAAKEQPVKKKRRGRPPGSKNQNTTAKAATTSTKSGKRRGRPPRSSSNNTTTATKTRSKTAGTTINANDLITRFGEALNQINPFEAGTIVIKTLTEKAKNDINTVQELISLTK